MWQDMLIGAVIASIIFWIIWPAKSDGGAFLRFFAHPRIESQPDGRQRWATSLVAVGFALVLAGAWLSFLIIAAIALFQSIT